MVELKLKILVAEDDENFRSVVVDYFKSREIPVIEASTGLKAIEIVSKDKSINYIISDWNMPGLTGYELLMKVKKMKGSDFDLLAFIMMTTVSEKGRIIKACRADIGDYILKPFRISVLEQRFEKLLLKKLPDEFIALTFRDIEKNNFEKALLNLEEAFYDDKCGLTGLCGLVICYAELEDMENASRVFDSIPKVMGTFQDPLYLYASGILSLAKNKTGDAISFFKECLQIDDSMIKAYIKLSQSYIKEKFYDDACQILRKLDIEKVVLFQDIVKIKDILQKIDIDGGAQCRELLSKYIIALNDID